MSDFEQSAKRNWCGITHYAGCSCHEKRRDEEIKSLRQQLAESQRVLSGALGELAEVKAELEHTMAAASIHADEHRKARHEIERLMAENARLTLAQLLKEMEERAEKATKAGCLPADNCVFDPSEGCQCVFCGRESGKEMNMYREEWAELDTLRRQDIPRLIAALRLAVEQRDGYIESYVIWRDADDHDAKQLETMEELWKGCDAELASILEPAGEATI